MRFNYLLCNFYLNQSRKQCQPLQSSNSNPRQESRLIGNVDGIRFKKTQKSDANLHICTVSAKTKYTHSIFVVSIDRCSILT